MQFEMESSEMRYAKELQFGRIMLRRAKRVLAKLQLEIQTASDKNLDTSLLEAEFHRLRESIADFEREYDTFQAQLSDLQLPDSSGESSASLETPSI
ncbi:MAG: hypothetical protein K6T81_15610 [Alicyclobacillus macrosporangiidus]|uniref:hypothetical protein n=1 Tax=Alicyclobacillus macrosporangiidus TaxID=392015 RepID=UPI0026F0686D|nr:hypothetical protein [Alicyclobacillus macrosporangiidus]MCL6600144.1 hypothetical protein [Alicyclobacillus macrosporangiidus]